MQGLLFLAHRIPYPPTKGDKIRSFHLLKYLSERYRVYLGTFIDDPADWQHVAAVRALCADACFIKLGPLAAKLGSLRCFGSNRALTLGYYRKVALQRWVDTVLARGAITHALAFSGAMAQYIAGPEYARLRRVIDFVDVDSVKWGQYGHHKAWPVNWIFRRESRTLLQFERSVAAHFDASVFVTPEEAALFRRLAPESAERISAIANGVDTDYFDPAQALPDPYPPEQPVLVFTGAMDYWANADAVQWFAQAVWPTIRQALPEAGFYIVGTRPLPAVQQLAQLPGVRVTGAVPDVRPYLAHARAAVAPLRIARGVQNKVLEALAMAKPVLATTAALEGIALDPRLRRWQADTAPLLAKRAVTLLQQGDCEGGLVGRRWVVTHYNWDHNLQYFGALLAGSGSAAPTDGPFGLKEYADEA